MSDQLFNGRTFAENLDFISDANKSILDGGPHGLGWAGEVFDILQAEVAPYGKSLNVFLAQYNKQNPLPQSWESFITALRRDFLGQNPPLPPETTVNSTFSELSQKFLGLTGQFELIPPFSSLLTRAFSEGGTFNSGEQFKRAFADFLSNYPYKPNGSVGSSIEFFQNLNEFFGTISKASENGVVNTNGSGVPNIITSYQEIFDQFPAPSETRFTSAGVPFPFTPGFEEKFTEFYQSYLAEHGYFATSRAFDEWTQKIQKEYSVGLRSAYPLTPLDGSGVGRAVTTKVTGTQEFTAFSPNIDLSSIDLGLSSITFTLKATSPETIVGLEKFKFDNRLVVVSPPTAPNSSPGLNFTFTFPPEYVQIDITPGSPTFGELHPSSVAILKDLIKSIVNGITFESSSGIAGPRTFELVDADDTVLATKTIEIKGVSIVNTSVTTDSTARVLVINRLFKLIGEMIDTMQQVAAVQAQYLSFLTQWQKAYTDLINEIKTFTRNDGTVFGRVDNASATVQTFSTQRGDANTFSLNQREKLSNLRGVVSDTAKRIQSNVNASQDAATQQGQFATSLLQQLSTILGAIYR